MAEIINFFDKYKDKISDSEMNKLLEDAIQVVVGYGINGPTQMFLTKNNLIVGRIVKSDAEFVVACLRDVADAIENEAAKA